MIFRFFLSSLLSTRLYFFSENNVQLPSKNFIECDTCGAPRPNLVLSHTYDSSTPQSLHNFLIISFFCQYHHLLSKVTKLFFLSLSPNLARTHSPTADAFFSFGPARYFSNRRFLSQRDTVPFEPYQSLEYANVSAGGLSYSTASLNALLFAHGPDAYIKRSWINESCRRTRRRSGCC